VTLIDYLNRVHFAENILEEALWAELEQRPDAKFLILSTAEDLGSELGERLKSGLPKQLQTVTCQISGGVPNEAEARLAARFFRQNHCDAILACGRGYVINLAKAVRLLIGRDAPLALFSEAEGGSAHIPRNLPDLIAVPRLQGFVAGFNGLLSITLSDGKMIDIASRNNVPTITIGDPTVAMQESASVQASACVEAVTLCIEALLSPNYNPPASGMAMDGLKRGLHAMASVSDHANLEARRELMAACMNAAMVQQKGLGLVHAITSSLCAASIIPLDKGAIKRLLLPEILEFYATQSVLARSSLMGAMGLTNPTDVIKSLRRVLGDLPLAESLSDLGVTEIQIKQSCERAAQHRALSNTPYHPAAGDIRRLLSSIQ
jgi:4-hydroxybutyrate dehydrogenase